MDWEFHPLRILLTLKKLNSEDCSSSHLRASWSSQRGTSGQSLNQASLGPLDHRREEHLDSLSIRHLWALRRAPPVTPPFGFRKVSVNRKHNPLLTGLISVLHVISLFPKTLFMVFLQGLIWSHTRETILDCSQKEHPEILLRSSLRLKVLMAHRLRSSFYPAVLAHRIRSTSKLPTGSPHSEHFLLAHRIRSTFISYWLTAFGALSTCPAGSPHSELFYTTYWLTAFGALSTGSPHSELFSSCSPHSELLLKVPYLGLFTRDQEPHRTASRLVFSLFKWSLTHAQSRANDLLGDFGQTASLSLGTSLFWTQQTSRSHPRTNKQGTTQLVALSRDTFKSRWQPEAGTWLGSTTNLLTYILID